MEQQLPAVEQAASFEYDRNWVCPWQVANHPDLVTAAFDKDNLEYPPAAQLIAECGKMALLDRMLTQLRARGHKVRVWAAGLWPKEQSGAPESCVHRAGAGCSSRDLLFAWAVAALLCARVSACRHPDPLESCLSRC